jgi:Chitobiase/beta-hexosaminidase C-terminal domain/Putative Ig domain
MMQFRSTAMSFGPSILTQSPLVSGEVGVAYNQQLQGTSGDPPYTWSLNSGAFPTGLSLSPIGVISGTPSVATSTTPVVLLTDSAGGHATRAYLITTVAAVTITTSSPLPAVNQGSAYSQPLAAANGVTPYVWSLLSQTGSNTWSVSSSGVVTATPLIAETDTITVQVNDALGGIASKTFSITVNSNLAATPTFSPAGGTYSSAQTVTISCTTPSSTIYYTTDGTTPTTGSPVYSSPITVSTTETVQAIATAAGFSQSNVGSATYTISSGGGALVILNPSVLPAAQQGFQYQLALPVVLGTAPYTGSLISQTGANAGVWSLSTTGLLAGTPTASGTDTITVSFNDSASNTTGNVAFTVHTSAVGGTLTSSVGSTYTAPAATPGGNYALPLNGLVSGGMPPYAWKAGSGSVVGTSGTSWQSETSFNSLQGQPATGTSGTDSVAMVCTDSLGATVSITFSIPISATLAWQGIIPGTTSGQPLPQAMVGNAYGTTYLGHVLVAAGGSGSGYTFSSVSGLPPGLGITGNIITGTPTAAGTYNWAIKVTDSSSNTATYTFSIIVSPSLNTSPPSWCTGSGKAFYVKSGRMYDWTGAPYIGYGLNINHADQNWHSGSLASPNGLAATRSNIARMFLTQYYFSWSTMAGYIDDVTSYGAVCIVTLAANNGNFGTTPGAHTYGENANNQFADCLYQIYQGSSTLVPRNDAIFLCLANEFGSYGSTAMQNQWAAVGLSASNVPNISVASVSGTTITLASSVTGSSNPFANSCVGLIQGGTGGTQFVYITGTGGSSGAWTVTSYSSLTSSTGGTLVGGGIGVARAMGLTCPIWVDAGSDPYISSQLPQFQAILASDPLGNVLFDVHYYNNTIANAVAITGITKANPGVISFDCPSVFMGGQNANPMDEGSGNVTTFWNNFVVYGVQGMTQMNSAVISSQSPTAGSGGSYTQNTGINTSGYGTYTGGGWLVPTSNGHIYYQYQAANNAAIGNLGVCVWVGEFGPPTPPLQQTYSNWCPVGFKAQAAINNLMGYVYWAMDDNGETYPSQGAFCITQLNAVGVYQKPTDLVWHGADIVLHPTYGITALSLPPSALI